MTFLSFTDNLLQDAYIIFRSSVDNFEENPQNMPNFSLICSSPLMHSKKGAYVILIPLWQWYQSLHTILFA